MSKRKRVRYGTQTAQGYTCFTGVRTLREAKALAEEWSKKFPECAPYAVTRKEWRA